MRWLTAIPVYNEAAHIQQVLAEVRRYSREILIVNDGSTDGTAALLATESSPATLHPPPSTLHIIAHPRNRGYGALISAFDYAREHDYEVLVTMDCDGQHQPGRIHVLLEAIHDADIVSGSRYLRNFRQNNPAPTERRAINQMITQEINARYGLNLTDSFCGFKAYCCSALAQLRITETGWGMPLQLWVQAARLGLRVKEIGVPRLYLDAKRAFGGVMDDADVRLAYYRRVLSSAEKDVLPALPTVACAPEPAWEPCR